MRGEFGWSRGAEFGCSLVSGREKAMGWENWGGLWVDGRRMLMIVAEGVHARKRGSRGLLAGNEEVGCRRAAIEGSGQGLGGAAEMERGRFSGGERRTVGDVGLT